jgi:allantoicase
LLAPEDRAGSLSFPDLASRSLRGSVTAASDEFFAEKENLIKPGAAVYSPSTFGHKGQVYDGWETRRRRGPAGSLPPADACDWVIVRLGAPGVVHAVVVDTAHFTGNFPQSCSVEACNASGYPGVDGLLAAQWTEIVPRSPLRGDTSHAFSVPAGQRYTHVRLRIYPDGGVARLRVHGEVVPDPALLDGLTFDLAALENGGDVRACSDRFYSAPRNAISPGLSRVMGEGWETRRRRSAGNEWLAVGFAAPALVSLVEIDTSGYLGNAPGAASLRAYAGGPWESDSSWAPLLPRTSLLPDTPHRFRVQPAAACDLVRLDVFPDGGVARLRLHGSLTPDGLAQVRRRWAETGSGLRLLPVVQERSPRRSPGRPENASGKPGNRVRTTLATAAFPPLDRRSRPTAASGAAVTFAEVGARAGNSPLISC